MNEQNVLIQLGPLMITMTVVTTWGIMGLIWVCSWLITRHLRIDPGPLQTAVEGIVSNIEDAVAVEDKDLVIFADASTEDIEDFILTPVDASTKVAFTTHAASPGYIMGLSKKLYNKFPPTYLLHIKGYEWDFREGLSKQAKQNLEGSLKMIKEKFGQDFIAVTPGIRPGWGAHGKNDQRRVTTPARAIENGSDYLVIGRSIRDAKNPKDAADRIAEEIETVL